MSEAVHEYTPGDQDITEQLATFSLFGKMMKWGSLAVAVLVVMLVLWFCVQAGFFAGARRGYRARRCRRLLPARQARARALDFGRWTAAESPAKTRPARKLFAPPKGAVNARSRRHQGAPRRARRASR